MTNFLETSYQTIDRLQAKIIALSVEKAKARLSKFDTFCIGVVHGFLLALIVNLILKVIA